jgi:GNAT superfamily N-acetyltransferase
MRIFLGIVLICISANTYAFLPICDFANGGAQVGFARAVTDSATYAYLADIYIMKEHRGLGLSKWLMEEVVSHPRLQRLRRMTLATVDAHGLYEKYGFKPLAKPEIFMEAWNPNVYKDA